MTGEHGCENQALFGTGMFRGDERTSTMIETVIEHIILDSHFCDAKYKALFHYRLANIPAPTSKAAAPAAAVFIGAAAPSNAIGLPVAFPLKAITLPVPVDCTITTVG